VVVCSKGLAAIARGLEKVVDGFGVGTGAGV